MLGELALQTAVFTTLSNYAPLTALLATYGGSPAIFDAPPQVDDAGDNTDYPYLSFGYSVSQPFDGDTFTGSESIVSIHTWGRGQNFAQIKAIMEQVYNALHRVDFAISGHAILGCDIDQSETMRDPDGETVHGVQRFRIIFE